MWHIRFTHEEKGGATFVLADVAQRMYLVGVYQRNGLLLVQEVARPRAAELEVYPRGNVRSVAQFTVLRVFASVAERVNFQNTHPEALGVDRGTLVVTVSRNFTSFTSAMARAVARVPRMAALGVSLEIDYEVTGGAMSSNEP